MLSPGPYNMVQDIRTGWVVVSDRRLPPATSGHSLLPGADVRGIRITDAHSTLRVTGNRKRRRFALPLSVARVDAFVMCDHLIHMPLIV